MIAVRRNISAAAAAGTPSTASRVSAHTRSASQAYSGDQRAGGPCALRPRPPWPRQWRANGGLGMAGETMCLDAGVNRSPEAPRMRLSL
jgi:hypothetical protein